MNKAEMNKVLIHPCTVFTVTDEIKFCSSLFSSSALFDTVKTVIPADPTLTDLGC